MSHDHEHDHPNDHDAHDHGAHDHDAHSHADQAHGQGDQAHKHDHDDPGHDHAGHDHAGHDHAGHDHHHHAPPDRMTRAFVLGMALNVAFVIAGVIAGVAAHSTALLADAAHNFGDVLGLGMAWGAMALARRERTARHTYGLRRTTILAALGNGGLVLFAIGGVVWEAVQRLTASPQVDGGIVAAVAALGVVLNALAALL